mmetsp:Transcript_78919/g.211852  ORF Transcript_78919/g.211852 Transcript_78919/m.211852 type:complete len:103 (-) Transcript_78919:258-566(-)
MWRGQACVVEHRARVAFLSSIAEKSTNRLESPSTEMQLSETGTPPCLQGRMAEIKNIAIVTYQPLLESRKQPPTRRSRSSLPLSKGHCQDCGLDIWSLSISI